MQLTVSQYQELFEDETPSFYYKMIHWVSVIKDLDPVNVQKWDSDKLIDEYSKVKGIENVSTKFQSEISLSDFKVQLIQFEKITLGQFFSLEPIIESGFIQNLHIIATFIYLHHTGGDLFELEPEPMDKVNVKKRSEIIQELPIEHIYGACLKYNEFRKAIFENFDVWDDSLDGVNPDELTDEELEIYEEESKRMESNKADQLLSLLNTLAPSFNDTFDNVLKMPVTLCLNQLSWLKRNKK